MKIVVTGAGGQLGYDVMLELARRGHEGVGTDLAGMYSGAADALKGMRYVPMDITDAAAVESVLMQEKPDAVIHCAAFTNVDLAEEQHSLAFRINAEGTRNIARTCEALGCCMTYVSTDYVFDGQGDQPFSPDGSACRPLNVYGQSKLQGEQEVCACLDKYFIVRTAWVFGLNGKNFIKTMIDAGKNRSEVSVVNDQIGTPTYTADLARLLVDMNETEKYGVYHATNEGGYVSWYEFCCECYRQYGLTTRINPVTTAEYGRNKAVRPANSRLDRSKLREAGFEPLPDWRDAVGRYLKTAKL